MGWYPVAVEYPVAVMDLQFSEKGRKFLNQLPAFKGQFSMQSVVACSYELQRTEFYDEESY
jgi:hypothetical protein